MSNDERMHFELVMDAAACGKLAFFHSGIFSCIDKWRSRMSKTRIELSRLNGACLLLSTS